MKVIVITLLVMTLCLAAGIGAGAQKKKLPDPTARKDAILKLFVEEFVPITPGKGKFPESFLMGSEKGGHDNEKPAHKVTFKYSFAIGKYEVTQELYQVVTGINPAQFQGLRNGIDKTTWQDANDFCAKATKLLRENKLIGEKERIRLPSEAEWEYCCRAGTTTAWSFGDDVNELGKYSWFKENSAKEDPPVGKKLPNAWGLYDMHGYVWEWCLDAWSPDYKDAPTDGSAVSPKGDAKFRVARGGAYPDPPDMQRSAYRHRLEATTKSGAVGFRCVKDDEVKRITMKVGDTLKFSSPSQMDFKRVINPNSKVVDITGISPTINRVKVTAVGVGTSVVEFTYVDDYVEVVEFMVVAKDS